MDITAIIVALITAIPPTLMAFLAYRTSKATHTEVNSRMTELLEVTSESQFAKGAENQRQKEEKK